METITTAEQALAVAQRLAQAIHLRNQDLMVLDDYYEGRHPLQFATPRFREAFGGLFHEFSDNWCDLVVDAVEERLDVNGFRLSSDAQPSEEAHRLWQGNQMDADSQMLHTNALVHGAGYTMVGAGPQPDTALITVESATEVIVHHDPANRRIRLAALKLYTDEWSGVLFATLYTPDWVWRWSVNIEENRIRGREATESWERREVEEGVWPERNPYGRVMVVPFYNRPRQRHGASIVTGQAEHAKVIGVQNLVNKILMDATVTSEFQAFAQRWATGFGDANADPQTGEPSPEFKRAIEQFTAGASTLLTSTDAETSFGSFPTASIDNYVRFIELAVQHIASQSRTPPHYFYLGGTFPSGESIRSAEAGLVKKSRRKMRFFGESWEETIRLAALVAGDDQLAAAIELETMWADPETRTQSELADSLIKLREIGVPEQQLWEDYGYSPVQIARFDQMRAQQALMGAGQLDLLEQAQLLQRIYLAVPEVLNSGEARDMAREAGVKLEPGVPDDVGPVTPGF